MNCGGFCFTYWNPTKLKYDELVDLCAKEEVGNTLQFWQNNDTLARLTRRATKLGLYSTCIYSRATNGIARAMTEELGDRWLGHDFGERYTFSLYQNWDNRGATLDALADST